jgi:hypothetical protein
MQSGSPVLGDIADELDKVVVQLRTVVADFRGVSGAGLDANLAALKRIRVARSRLAGMLQALSPAPGFVAQELRALVAQRLAPDDELELELEFDSSS